MEGEGLPSGGTCLDMSVLAEEGSYISFQTHYFLWIFFLAFQTWGPFVCIAIPFPGSSLCAEPWQDI